MKLKSKIFWKKLFHNPEDCVHHYFGLCFIKLARRPYNKQSLAEEEDILCEMCESFRERKEEV